MKRLFNLLTFLVTFFFVFELRAQNHELDNYIEENADIYYGAKSKIHKNNFIDRYLGTSMGFHFFLTGKGKLFSSKEVSIDKVNSNMKLVRNKEISISSASQYGFVVGSQQKGDSIIVFVANSKRAGKSTILKACYLDPKTVRLTDLIDLTEVEVAIDSYGGERNIFFGSVKDHSNYFKILEKPDKTGFMVFSNFKEKKSKENEKFGIGVFDNNFEKKWSINVELPYVGKLFSVEDVSIDNNENVYLAGKLFENRKVEVKKKEVNYETKILRFQKGDSKPSHEYNVGFNKKPFPSLMLRPTDNRVTLVAFYTDIKGNSVEGFYSCHLNPESGEIYNEKIQPFDEEFLLEGLTEKQQARAEKRIGKGKSSFALAQLKLDYFVVMEDGDLIVAAEQRLFYVVTTTSQVGNAVTSNTEYHYENHDMVLFRITPDNNVTWYTKVPKRQHTINNRGYTNGYALMFLPEDNKIALLFNEGIKAYQEKYLEKQGFYSMYTARKASLTSLALIDVNSGEFTKKEIHNVKKKKLFSVMSVSHQINSNAIIFPMEFKKNRVYSKFSLNSRVK